MLSSDERKLIDKILSLQGDPQKEAMFYYYLFDPVFFHQVLFDREVPPHQRVKMRLMWWRPFYVDCSGYRDGKSTTATYVQMMQCALISGWHEGILSHTLRGAQYLFRDHIIENYERNKVFRGLIRKKPTRGNEWRIEYRNGSSITAFPADILNRGMRLESLSLSASTIDEATSFPDPDVLWDVMFNRVTMPPPPTAQRLGITNTIRLLGAAKFSFQAIYKAQEGKGGLIHMVIQRMKEWTQNPTDPLDYVYIATNLREHLPPDGWCWACDSPTKNLGMQPNGKPYVKCTRCGYTRVAWQQFFSSTLRRLNDAEKLMSKKLFAMRWLGKWQDTSDDVYEPSKVNSMPQPDCLVETERSGEDSIYAIGVDVGTGSSERHSVSSVTIIKFSPPDPHYRVVYSQRYSCTLSDLSGYIYDLWLKFSPQVIMVDPGGGGVWLVDKDHMGGTSQKISRGRGIVEEDNTTPLVMMDDYTSENGARVVQLFTSNCWLVENSIGGKGAADALINWAHDTCSDLINRGLLISPYTYFGKDGKASNNTEEIFKSINDARFELTTIGILQKPDGSWDLTKTGFFQYYPKPDGAYSLVYALSGMYLYVNLDKDMLYDTPGSQMPIIGEERYEGKGLLPDMPTEQEPHTSAVVMI